MKNFWIMAALVAIVVVGANTADAQSRRILMSPKGGTCPSGTLSNHCTARAVKVSNCTTANMRRCTDAAMQTNGRR